MCYHILRPETHHFYKLDNLKKVQTLNNNFFFPYPHEWDIFETNNKLIRDFFYKKRKEKKCSSFMLRGEKNYNRGILTQSYFKNNNN